MSFTGGEKVDERLFSYYWDKVYRPGDGIILTHIIKPKDTRAHEWKETQKKLLHIITPFIDECKSRNVHYQSIFHSGKSPGEALCELVFEHTPDLVMLCAPVQQSKLQKTLTSSVSECILEKSTTPVLIVPHGIEW